MPASLSPALTIWQLTSNQAEKRPSSKRLHLLSTTSMILQRVCLASSTTASACYRPSKNVYATLQHCHRTHRCLSSVGEALGATETHASRAARSRNTMNIQRALRKQKQDNEEQLRHLYQMQLMSEQKQIARKSLDQALEKADLGQLGTFPTLSYTVT